MVLEGHTFVNLRKSWILQMLFWKFLMQETRSVYSHRTVTSVYPPFIGCRCPDVERKILAKDPNKKIILVLNKVDLIPKENVEAWLKYLRREYPTIAFKCSTQVSAKQRLIRLY
jgi:hypothetical protein